MKSLGYSSKDLMTQLALQVLPATIVSSVIGSVLSVIVEKLFWFVLFGVDKATDYAVVIITSVLMVIFCYAVTYLAAGKIKKISVNELMTE
jgi:ABC-type antimicrobial peptide transport system permease subunit